MERMERICTDFSERKSVLIRQIRVIRVLFLGLHFQLHQPGHRLRRRIAAHFWLWAQVGADGGAVWMAEDQAVVVVAQLDAAYASGFALGHAGGGR